MRLSIAGYALALAIIGSTDPSYAQGQRCPAITDASRAGLYVMTGERQNAVEGSAEVETRREDIGMKYPFFEVAFSAAKVRSRCARIGWRVESIGPNPVDAADFGGKFPSGVATLTIHHDGEPIGGEIELWVPNDRRAERPEQFRIVLLNPLTRQPLAGTVGRYDGSRGVPVFRAPAASLAMANRLIMTVEDAPEQRTRR